MNENGNTFSTDFGTKFGYKMYVKNGKKQSSPRQSGKTIPSDHFFVKNAIWADFEVPAASQM